MVSSSHYDGLPWCSDGKASDWNVGDPGSIPGSEICSGEGNGNPLQWSGDILEQDFYILAGSS